MEKYFSKFKAEGGKAEEKEEAKTAVA